MWQGEAERIGWKGHLHVISYHQLAAAGAPGPDGGTRYEAVAFDEAHYLKNARPGARKAVSWTGGADRLTRNVPRVYLASGTPTPNEPAELWAQLRMLRFDDPTFEQAYWNWVKSWFNVFPDRFTQFNISEYLLTCESARCFNWPKVTGEDCEHWAEFRQANQVGWMMARPESLLDLPPMSGANVPLHAPMKKEQARAYREMKKNLIADLPPDSELGTLEAMSESQASAMLQMLATGISSADPAADPDDRHSGKLSLLAELLDDRRHPALVACYYRNSAAAIGRVCERLNKRYAYFGAKQSPKARRDAIAAFQAGALDVLIGSINVVKEGITLTAGDGVFLVERDWRPDANKQVVRRVRRRGQDKPVVVRQLVAPKTVDEGQWKTLEGKITRVAKVDVKRLWDGEVVEVY